MKKIILLISFILLLVFPPIAWDQDQNYGAGSVEYMRQQERQMNDNKAQVENQQTENKTDGLEEKQLKKAGELRDQEGKQKN
jgi:hypothetical protein